MESGEDAHRGRKVQGVRGSVGVHARDSVRSVEAHHELSNAVGATLHVFMLPVEGGKQHFVPDGETMLRAARHISMDGLGGLRKKQSVLRLHDVRFERAQGSQGGVSVCGANLARHRFHFSLEDWRYYSRQATVSQVEQREACGCVHGIHQLETDEGQRAHPALLILSNVISEHLYNGLVRLLTGTVSFRVERRGELELHANQLVKRRPKLGNEEFVSVGDNI